MQFVDDFIKEVRQKMGQFVMERFLKNM